MKPLYHQPVFLLGIVLGFSLCLLVPHLLPLRHRRAITRQRRDIKTIPREFDGTTQTKTNTWSNSKSSEEPQHDSLNLDLELSREKRRKGLLHAEILGTRGTDAETAVYMTWASVGLTHHVTPRDPAVTSAYQHMWHGIRQLCSEPLLKDWYLLVKDSVYVNTDRLQEVVLTLSAEDSLVLGVPSPTYGSYCSLDAGVLFSRNALQTTCTIVERCASQPTHTHTFGHCLEKEGGVTCSDVLQMTGSMHLPNPDPATLQAQLTLYVGPVPAPDDLYKIHLLFTEHRISLIQQHVFWLAQQMELDSSSKPRPKRNSPDFEQTVLQSHGSILNSSTEPLMEYFDTSGNVYSDSCVVTKDNVSKPEGFRNSEYLARQFLSSEFGREVGKQDYFGFRVIKPLSGMEYQYYYVHEDQINKHGYYYDKLYQVIVKQEYEKLQVQEKRSRDIEDITIVTIADDISLLTDLLQSLVDNCVRVAKSNSKCSVLLLYDTDLFNADFDSGDLGRVLSSIDNQGVDIRTLNIGMASHIMNNFQRAVVSVHETLIDNSLIVFLHPKSHITEHFLYRCQANTSPGASAYFPVPYQYTRDSNRVASDSGFWKNTDYDTFCIHTKDLQRLLILPKSPQMLYQFLVSLGELDVRRIADVGIWRKWADGLCSDLDPDLGFEKCQQDFMYRNL